MQVLFRPLNDLEAGAPDQGLTSWTAKGGDPQLSLLADGVVLPPGWYRFDMQWRVLGGKIENPVVYPDFGDGYSESGAIQLDLRGRGDVRHIFLHFSNPVTSLRFDPSTQACRFIADKPALHAMTAAEIARDRFCWLVVRGHPALRIWTRLRDRAGADLDELARSLIRECTAIEVVPPAKAVSAGLVGNVFGGIAEARAQGESWRTISGNAWRALTSDGFAGFRARLDRFVRRPGRRGVSGLSDYESWLVRQDGGGAGGGDGGAGPLISIVVPTFKPPMAFLRAAIDSVLGQSYSHFEICISDDGSDDPQVERELHEYAARDKRVRYVLRPARGGIAVNTNAAIALASGEYLLFLDHDDLLHRDALRRLAESIRDGSAGDIVYSDHDCVGPDGRRRNPFFKPDWSPDLFLAQMYLGHFVAIRREFIASAGDLRTDCDGAQDYDLALRCVALGARVSHIPEVLYHWRQHPDSTAANPLSKPYAHEAGRRAIQHHLGVVAPGARADDGAFLFTYDVRYPLPAPVPRAAIVIPTRDHVDLLAACVDSIVEHTRYADFEIVIIDNGSVETATHEYFARARRDHANLRVLDAPIPFNWSRLNNLGVAGSDAQVYVFLNNDTAVISPDWLERLVENATRPDVGVCGPLLLYEDGTIQHAGVVVGMGGWADHVYKGEPPQHRQDLFVSPMLRRNVLAVTGACMAIEASKFRRFEGFDESFLICGSDVDLCLRMHRAGLRNIYLPEARLFHYESKSRDPRDISPIDFQRSAESYGDFRTQGDPLYNRNLDPMQCVPGLRYAASDACAT